jgi:hypothetical protein
MIQTTLLKIFNTMEIIKSNKGGSKLLCDGFMYTKKKARQLSAGNVPKEWPKAARGH